MFWVILLLSLGLFLLAVEAFLIPGFGVVGIAGIIALVAGVVWGFSTSIFIGVMSLALSTAAVLIGIWIVSKTAGSRLVLETQLKGAVDSESRDEREQLIGQQGVTATVLRPAGSAEFNGRLYDVTSEDSYIKKGTAVVVVRLDHNQIFVRGVD